LLFAGNSFAQSNQQIDEEFYKQIPKNTWLGGTLQTTITTDEDLRDSRLKAGRAAVGKSLDEFTIVLEQAVLSNDGKILIEDGAPAYGVVVYSASYLTNTGNISKLELVLTTVQKRDGSLGRVRTKSLVFVEKRPTKKSVWSKSAVNSLSFGSLGAMFGPWGTIGGIFYGLGWGLGHHGNQRGVYRPKDITLFERRELYFKTQKVKK